MVDLNKHPNPLWFPYVEIKVSSPALVEEKEPQTPKVFDLCCHISSSDCMQIGGIRKPLTLPHSARLPLQPYPRWQNCGLDLQLDFQGQEISFDQNFPLFASFFSFPSSFLGGLSGCTPCGMAKKMLSAKHHVHLTVGPFCPCPSHKRKQLELWAAQWSCLFWAADGISSVDGSDLFLSYNMKHQLGLAMGKGEDGNV